MESVRPLNDRIGVLVALVLVVMVVIPWASALLSLALSPSGLGAAHFTLSILLQNALLAFLTLRRLKRLGVGWLDLRPYIENARQGMQAFGWGSALLFVNAFGAQLSALLFQLVAGPEALRRLLEREQAAVARLLDPEAGLVHVAVTVFLAVGVAPIVEELFFRGYAYPVLKYHAGDHARWLSALLFAGVHLYVVNFLPIFLLGWALASMYERSRSLAVPIVAHATVNGLVAVISVALARAGH